MFSWESINSDKIRSVIGALLINFFARPVLYWGNMSPYIMSYLVHPDVLSEHHYVINSWFVFTYNLAWTCGMLSNDFILGSIKSMKPRYLVAFGILMFNTFFFGSVLVFYAGISWNVYVIVFGLTGGLGIGVFECLVIRYYVVDWCDNNERGLLTALFISSSNLGAAILNKFTTFWINPNNLAPDVEIAGGKELVFSQDEIMDKTPSLFLVIGGTNLLLQFIGFCLVKDREEEPYEVDSVIPQRDYDTFGHNNARHPSTSTSAHSSFGIKDNVTGPANTSDTQVNKESSSMASAFLEFALSPRFLTLWCVYFCLSTSEIVAMIYYKIYGLLWIKDDNFFSSLGTTTSVMACVWTVLYGFYFDRVGSKIGLITFDLCLAVFTLLMYFTAQYNKWFFFATTLLAYGTATSMYISMVATTVDFFGKEHLGRNVGLLNLAVVVNAMTMSAIGESLIPRFGWFSVFAFSTCVCLVALFIIVLKIRN